MTNTNRTEGSKYQATRELGRVAIAKLIRADIKAAIAAGSIPAGTKVSVRAYRVTHSSAIDITITDVPAGFDIRTHSEDIDAARMRGVSKPWLTRPAYELLEVLGAIFHSYNYNNCDLQSDYFDVRFYGGVEFDYQLADSRTARPILLPVAKLAPVVIESLETKLSRGFCEVG
jgi:hypothetical protein